MKTPLVVIGYLLLWGATACGEAESSDTGQTSGSGGASGSGGSASTGGASTGASTGGGGASGNPAEKFAGTWQPSNRTMSGTCEPPSGPDEPMELVAHADGTVSYTVGACTLTFIVSGNVAEVPAEAMCGPGTYDSVRIELTGESQATLTTSGTLTVGPISCASDVSMTLTRISG